MRAIDADRLSAVLQKNFGHTGGAAVMQQLIDIAPTIDPVKHGRWICEYDREAGETEVTCSVCKDARTVNGCYVSTNGESLYFEDKYCPNCGARMDADE